MEAIVAFAVYLAAALVLLAVFVFVYSKITPYDDFALISHWPRRCGRKGSISAGTSA